MSSIDGNKETEIEYLGESPNGKYLKWDENGKTLINQEYKDGVIIHDNRTIEIRPKK